MAGVTRDVREAVLIRDNFQCQWCGVRIDMGHYSLQHRRARGMGNANREWWVNSPVNLVAVCGSGTTLCHGQMEKEPDLARARGFRLDPGQDPEEVLVVAWDGTHYRLHDGDWKTPAGWGAVRV